MEESIKIGRDIFGSQLLEMIQDPIFIKNEHGIYIGCNSAFEKFIGSNKKKILGLTSSEIAPNIFANTYTQANRKLLQQRSNQTYHASVEWQNGVTYKASFFKALLRDEDGHIKGLIGILKDISRTAEQHQIDPILTERELDILKLEGKGLTVKEIAQQLIISHHTVTHHCKSIHRKLQVKNKTLAVIKAKQMGLF